MVLLALQHILHLIGGWIWCQSYWWGNISSLIDRCPIFYDFPQNNLFTTTKTDKRISHFAAGAIISRENYNSWRFLGLSIRNAGRTIEDSAQGLGKGEIEEHLSVGQNLFVSFAKTFATEVLKHIPPWSLWKSLGEGFVALLHRDISQSTKMECFFISDLGEGGGRQMFSKTRRVACTKYLIF